MAHGKRPNQKLKPYIVYQYLLKNTDENHVVSGQDIVEYLAENYNLPSECRSIYEDIKEINRINLMMEEECSNVEEADAMLQEDEEAKTVVYDPHQKGYIQRSLSMKDRRNVWLRCCVSLSAIHRRKKYGMMFF